MPSKPPGYWDDFSNVKKELFEFIDAHGEIGVMPSKREMQAKGQNSLAVCRRG